jgi:NAD(P)H-hydrate repair Nnr-like enzyme with NAD(P)H-hydrate dehydratase domain
MSGSDPWPYVGAPRVLVEHASASEGLEIASALRRRGFDVALCSGPDSRCSCPLVEHDECALVDGADVIVAALGLGRSDQREVTAALRFRRQSKPVVLLAPADQVERWPELAEGCRVVADPASPDVVAAAVAASL